MSNYIEPRPIEVKALDDFCLYLKFEDGKEKVYDMKPLIEKIKFYEKLRNKEYFKLVKTFYDTVVWPNGEDVCPENLYYDSVDFRGHLPKASRQVLIFNIE